MILQKSRISGKIQKFGTSGNYDMDITDRWPLLWSIFSIITSLLFVTRYPSCVKIKILTRKLKNGIESKEIVSRELKAL